MSIEVKICGLKTKPALEAALEGGADYVGLVFFPASPRNVTMDIARELRDIAHRRAIVVALAVDPDDALVETIVRDVGPDMIQLHGNETPERCAAVRRLSGCGIIKAVKVATRADVELGLAWRASVDLLLFDAKAPAALAGALPGGNGLSFDWRALDGIDRTLPFMLSGGLDAANVATAIELTGAAAVDVSSGVERSPGEKDPALIKAFLAAAKGAC